MNKTTYLLIYCFTIAITFLLGCSEANLEANSEASSDVSGQKLTLPLNTIKIQTIGIGRLGEVKCTKEGDIGILLLNDNGYPYFCVRHNGKVLWMTPIMKDLTANNENNERASQTDVNIGFGDPIVQGNARFND
ncbi:hypothetical protein [Vibrio sp. B181a]|uniref:hypothetical protein n=1 Tax=Vibrio sp. B181a TaxID=2835906 RepID=UPI0025557580|nr:hypothetical protein [Vibrio sp. B181a]MDK9773331.1 hypothetical protein [Vibrio sp. B181a]